MVTKKKPLTIPLPAPSETLVEKERDIAARMAAETKRHLKLEASLQAAKREKIGSVSMQTERLMKESAALQLAKESEAKRRTNETGLRVQKDAPTPDNGPKKILPPKTARKKEEPKNPEFERELDRLENDVFRAAPSENGSPENERLENLRLAIESVFDPSNIRLKTVLTPEQIAHFVRAQIYAERYQSKVMASLIQTAMELQVSGTRDGGKGSGRGDMVEALRATIVTAEVDEKKSSNLRKRLLGF